MRRCSASFKTSGGRCEVENESMEFALLAWRDEGKWRVSQLSDEATSDIGIVLDALRAQQVDGGAIAMLSVDDQFFILIRQIGARMQMVLSDVITALDYEIAAEVLELLDLELPAEDDADEPAGDLNIFTDLGLDAMELQFICDDDEMFPDEQLEVIARRIGFGDQFIEVIDKL
ncbi:MAG: tRNA adenosine deaminase [Candidatus Nanopelagicaceae bacterium]|nr:tRNA adenosine deaminase [Candidatus Nanopelagicaceae bacterium]